MLFASETTDEDAVYSKECSNTRLETFVLHPYTQQYVFIFGILLFTK